MCVLRIHLPPAKQDIVCVGKKDDLVACSVLVLVIMVLVFASFFLHFFQAFVQIWMECHEF